MYFDQTTAQQAGRALDWFAIDNLFSAHCLCRKARKRRYELDTYWSARKDIAYSEGTACYNGRKSVYRVYAGLEEEMDAGKLALLHERFPEQVPADDSALGIGDLDLLYSGSAYIEIAKDGGTAKGVWYTVGLSAEPDENGAPRGGLYTGRAAVEFIKEDGQWKIWHLKWWRDLRCDYYKSWVDDAGAVSDKASYQKRDDAKAISDQPFHKPMKFHQPYKQTERKVPLPQRPKPYDTWNDTDADWAFAGFEELIGKTEYDIEDWVW